MAVSPGLQEHNDNAALVIQLPAWGAFLIARKQPPKRTRAPRGQCRAK